MEERGRFMKISRGKGLLLLGTMLVIIDQIIKVLIKTNMTLGEHFSVMGDWFQILFIENEGMAFGMKFGGMFGWYFSAPCAGGFPVWYAKDVTGSRYRPVFLSV